MLRIDLRNIAIVFIDKIFWILVIKNFKKTTLLKIVLEVILSPIVVDYGQEFTQDG